MHQLQGINQKKQVQRKLDNLYANPNPFLFVKKDKSNEL